MVKGNIGCLNLDVKDATIIYDLSLKDASGMVTGANKEGYHIKGVDFNRDLTCEFVDIAKVDENDKCKECGQPLTIKKGIEVGNIFQLGTKYTKSMGMTIHMPDGSQMNPYMGCYGIGVGRAIASIIEEKADDKGIVWPVSIAPWQIYLCPLKNENEDVLKETEKLYEILSNKYEVLYDDRKVSAGIKLTDSELMGMPVRVVISPRSLENQECEVTIRESGEKIMVKLDEIEVKLKEILGF